MRLGVLVCLAFAALASGGCRKTRAPDAPLRLGFFPNLTHAQALVGSSERAYANALDGHLEVKQFNAGPAAMEALIAGSLDLTYVGAGPAITAFIRSDGALRVIAGSASGGAVLVVRPEITEPEQLIGKRVGTPQLGNTQDIALRRWLKQRGLKVADRLEPDAVAVTPLSNADNLGLFQRGELAGAWVPEPWGARMVAEGRGKLLVDERTLWPGGRFPTTVLVVSTRTLASHRDEVKKLLRVHLALTRRAAADPQRFSREANAAFGRITGKPLPEAVLQDAVSRIEFTADPLEAQLRELAKASHSLGFVPSADISKLVDASLLEELRAEKEGSP